MTLLKVFLSERERVRDYGTRIGARSDLIKSKPPILTDSAYWTYHAVTLCYLRIK